MSDFEVKNSKVRISLIAAIAKNGVIGEKGEIPWYLPSDFAYFKKTTLNKPIIMGRKTFESIGKALPKRTNIIISRQKEYQPDNTIVINSIDGAIKIAKDIAIRDDVDEIMIIGGANIYQQTIDVAERLYISHVALDIKGDSIFPKIDENIWQVINEPRIEKSPKDSTIYKVKIYEKKT